MSERAVFMDRDGVLNRTVYYSSSAEWESPRTPEDFELLDGVVPALRHLRDCGFLLFVVSNQPSYAKGKTSREALMQVHQRLVLDLRLEEICLTDVYYCWHHPNGIITEVSGACECRKPSPFFLHRAAMQYDIDLAQSWMVGDRESDIECGRRAGARTIRIMSDHQGEGQVAPHFVAESLAVAAEIISREIRP